MIKVKLVCPYCGSDEITRDGPLEWDVEKQEWVSYGFVRDEMGCVECGKEFDEAAEERVE